MIDEQIIVSCALRSLREHRNFTQQEVAERASMDISAIGHLETAGRPPLLSTLQRVAHGAFGMSVAEFLAIGERRYAGENHVTAFGALKDQSKGTLPVHAAPGYLPVDQ